MYTVKDSWSVDVEGLISHLQIKALIKQLLSDGVGCREKSDMLLCYIVMLSDLYKKAGVRKAKAQLLLKTVRDVKGIKRGVFTKIGGQEKA